jgi:hypothetical protein
VRRCAAHVMIGSEWPDVAGTVSRIVSMRITQAVLCRPSPPLSMHRQSKLHLTQINEPPSHLPHTWLTILGTAGVPQELDAPTARTILGGYDLLLNAFGGPSRFLTERFEVT